MRGEDEVFTEVVIKIIIFWDITPCIPLNVDRRFGGTYRLHLQGRSNEFSNKRASKQVALNGLDGVMSQKMILFLMKICLFNQNQCRVLPMYSFYTKTGNETCFSLSGGCTYRELSAFGLGCYTTVAQLGPLHFF
jgi:hypothetical protein